MYQFNWPRLFLVQFNWFKINIFSHYCYIKLSRISVLSSMIKIEKKIKKQNKNSYVSLDFPFEYYVFVIEMSSPPHSSIFRLRFRALMGDLMWSTIHLIANNCSLSIWNFSLYIGDSLVIVKFYLESFKGRTL